MYTRQLQCFFIRQQRMPIHPAQHHRRRRKKPVELLIIGEALAGKFILIPATALYPNQTRMCIGKLFDPLYHLFRTRAAKETGREQRLAVTHKMRMRIDKTRVNKLAAHIDLYRRPIGPTDIGIRPGRQYLAVFYRHRRSDAKSTVDGIDLRVIDYKTRLLLFMTGRKGYGRNNGQG